MYPPDTHVGILVLLNFLLTHSLDDYQTFMVPQAGFIGSIRVGSGLVNATTD